MLPFLNRNAVFGFSLKDKWTYLLMCHTWAGHLHEIKKGQSNCKTKQPPPNKKMQTNHCTGKREKYTFFFVARDICVSRVFTDSGTMPTSLGLCVCIYLFYFIFFFYNHMAWFCFPDLIWELLFEIKMFVSISSLIIVIQPAAAKWQNRCNDEN